MYFCTWSASSQTTRDAMSKRAWDATWQVSWELHVRRLHRSVTSGLHGRLHGRVQELQHPVRCNTKATRVDMGCQLDTGRGTSEVTRKTAWETTLDIAWEHRGARETPHDGRPPMRLCEVTYWVDATDYIINSVGGAAVQCNSEWTILKTK